MYTLCVSVTGMKWNIHTVMLYVQKMADPSDSVQLLPHLVDHQNSVKNPIVNTYSLILSSYHVTNRK